MYIHTSNTLDLLVHGTQATHQQHTSYTQATHQQHTSNTLDLLVDGGGDLHLAGAGVKIIGHPQASGPVGPQDLRLVSNTLATHEHHVSNTESTCTSATLACVANVLRTCC
jgi:hypothetical protein